MTCCGLAQATASRHLNLRRGEGSAARPSPRARGPRPRVAPVDGPLTVEQARLRCCLRLLVPPRGSAGRKYKVCDIKTRAKRHCFSFNPRVDIDYTTKPSKPRHMNRATHDIVRRQKPAGTLPGSGAPAAVAPQRALHVGHGLARRTHITVVSSHRTRRTGRPGMVQGGATITTTSERAGRGRGHSGHPL